MEGDSYPECSLSTPEKITLRDLLPIYPPPEPLQRPPLPSPPRKPAFDAPYTLSTHLVPAAYLRTTRPAPVPAPPPPDISKEARNQILEKTFQTLLAARSQTANVTDGYPRVLWNCLNRYVKKGLKIESRSTSNLKNSIGGGITLFLAHANGFPKETWEPMLAHLLSSQAAVNLIDEVWSWEAIQHGDAALVNLPSASGVFDWTDNARDIVNFLVNFLPSKTVNTDDDDASPMPTHLPRVTSQEAQARLKRGFRSRRVVVVGHSMGGCSSALAACVYPALFKAVILVDPVILYPTENAQQQKSDRLATAALSRRERWFSKDEVLKSFQSNPFFQSWDPSVLNLYVQYGTYLATDPHNSGPSVVQLKTSAIQEAIVFTYDHLTQRETFQRMTELDESIPLRWVIPGRPGHLDSVGGPGDTARRVWVRPRNSTNVKIKGAGHLIPHEAPKQLAEDIAQFLLLPFSSDIRSYPKPNL